MSKTSHEIGPAPERFVTTPFSDPMVSGVYKLFGDPDMISAYRHNSTGDFAMSWPTDTTAVEAIAGLEEFIDEAGFKQGRILIRPEGENGKIGTKDYRLKSALSEIPNTDPEKLYGFVLSSGRTILCWNPQWPKTYHDLHPQEVSVNLPEKSGLARRAVLMPAIAATAMPDLRASLDETLDEFAVRGFPDLAR